MNHSAFNRSKHRKSIHQSLLNNRGVIIGAALGACALGSLVFFVGLSSTESNTSTSDAANSSKPSLAESLPMQSAQDAPPTQPRIKSISFAYDSADLDTESRQALDSWASALSQNKTTTLQLEGHCDERGSDSYNHELGLDRAKAAKSYLLSQGIPATRLSVVSYGENRPAVFGSDDVAHAANRRVEFRFINTLTQR